MGYLIPKFITMVMKEYSTFPKATALLKPRHQIVSCHIQDIRCGGGVLPLCWEAVYSLASAELAIGHSLEELVYSVAPPPADRAQNLLSFRFQWKTTIEPL